MTVSQPPAGPAANQGEPCLGAQTPPACLRTPTPSLSFLLLLWEGCISRPGFYRPGRSLRLWPKRKHSHAHVVGFRATAAAHEFACVMAGMASSATEPPHRLLTTLQQCPREASIELADLMKSTLLADAQRCIELMIGRHQQRGPALALGAGCLLDSKVGPHLPDALLGSLFYLSQTRWWSTPSLLGAPGSIPRGGATWLDRLFRGLHSLALSSCCAALPP